jgi:hypothetical protein
MGFSSAFFSAYPFPAYFLSLPFSCLFSLPTRFFTSIRFPALSEPGIGMAMLLQKTFFSMLQRIHAVRTQTRFFSQRNPHFFGKNLVSLEKRCIL